jgi:cytidylate kinase
VQLVKWVEDPKSKLGLALLSQAGTGKSSIAHDVARRFDDKYLGSYFSFLRKAGFNFQKAMLTSSSGHLRAISPIAILCSNSPSGTYRSLIKF